MVDGDVEAGVADCLARTGEAARVAQLAQHGDGGEGTDPVELTGQHAAALKAASGLHQLLFDGEQLLVDPIDGAQREVDGVPGRRADIQSGEPGSAVFRQ